MRAEAEERLSALEVKSCDIDLYTKIHLLGCYENNSPQRDGNNEKRDGER